MLLLFWRAERSARWWGRDGRKRKRPPTITRVVPSSGPATGGTSVEVTGTGLTADVRCWFGTAQGTVTSWADWQIRVTTPPGPVGLVPVTVATAGGEAVFRDGFRYLAAPPPRPRMARLEDAWLFEVL